MKISAQMLYEAVKENTQVRLLGTCSPERNLRFLSFYDGEDLRPGGVYLAQPEELPRRTEQKDVLFVTCADGPVEPVAGAPLLVFPRGISHPKLFNRIQQIFVSFCSWEEQLDGSLSQGSSIQKMIDLAETRIAPPLCVVDSSLNYLGYSGSFMSREREIFFPGGNVREVDLHQMENPPVPDLYYDPALDRKAELKNGDYVLGTLYMIHSEEPFSQTELLLFDLLAEKLTSAMENLSLLSGLYQNSFKQNLVCLFQSGQVDEARLWDSLTQWGGRKGDRFLCYKVKASHIHQKINADYVCRIFETVLYHAVAFWHNAVLVVLVDTNLADRIHEKMRALLDQLGLKAGVSLPFTDLTRAWYHFRQACCAFDEGYPVKPEDSLYFFRDYVPSYMLHHALGEFPRSFLLDEGMQRLLDHDRSYSVSYLETLEAFFRCRMNMSQTAEVLGIHRTSLTSRMQKITELLDREPDQEYLLYVQMMLAILRFGEK